MCATHLLPGRPTLCPRRHGTALHAPLWADGPWIHSFWKGQLRVWMSLADSSLLPVPLYSASLNVLFVGATIVPSDKNLSLPRFASLSISRPSLVTNEDVS
jgi:hypothetical protein